MPRRIRKPHVQARLARRRIRRHSGTDEIGPILAVHHVARGDHHWGIGHRTSGRIGSCRERRKRRRRQRGLGQAGGRGGLAWGRRSGKDQLGADSLSALAEPLAHSVVGEQDEARDGAT
eukprot:scaffold15156_cov101-Isochrysis_galbana.AAC.3